MRARKHTDTKTRTCLYILSYRSTISNTIFLSLSLSFSHTHTNHAREECIWKLYSQSDEMPKYL